MKPISVDITDIKYRRPGLTKIDFSAAYDGFYRRGTITYSTITKQFLSHTSDVELLAAVCIGLQTVRNYKVN